MEKATELVEREKQRREQLHGVLRKAQKALLQMECIFYEQ